MKARVLAPVLLLLLASLAGLARGLNNGVGVKPAMGFNVRAQRDIAASLQRQTAACARRVAQD